MRWIKKIVDWLMEEKTEVVPFKESKGNEGVIVLGHYASQLINNPAVDAAFKKIENDIILAWKTSPPKSRLEREHLYYRMEGLAQVRLKLTGMVNNMLQEERIAKQKQGQAEGNPEKETLWN